MAVYEEKEVSDFERRTPGEIGAYYAGMKACAVMIMTPGFALEAFLNRIEMMREAAEREP